MTNACMNASTVLQSIILFDVSRMMAVQILLIMRGKDCLHGIKH